ncbi:para-nitrobenzyl esterase [Chryseobacterium sp. Leaf180]|uniref:carboxylesterase family protein n=1 Tax=Chryseobacterium sp. Leaf180 TaxID=1736289 RepID=UPI0006F69540|nr:carboxylesterase family protein [Chryseobacterium sp. Leaf180]KQR93683.1 para-nitrobenzyl esterase [Chryseobacterium sp. Leaf180]
MKTEVKTNTGIIKLQSGNDILSAKNIRYATSERFQKPEAMPHSESYLNLPEKTQVCPQAISPLLEKMIGKIDPEIFEVNESPQFLSVYCPENMNMEKKIPVIVWIHGGSYELGCGDLSTADPTVFVKEQKVIFVTVSYRVGLFGFLGGTENRPANLGLLDITEALRWIKNNIKFFGGDEESITLFGQSSGGDAVAHLMISEGTENLFRRVIIQSAPLGLGFKRQKMSAEMLRPTQNFKNEDSYDAMIELYRKNIPPVYKFGLKALMPFGVQYGFLPLCKEEETQKKWQEAARKFDVLIGLNDKETSFYLRSTDSKQNYLKKTFLEKAIRSTTERIYGNPAKQFAENLALAGGNVYLYRIFSKFQNAPFAAAHAIDLPLVFGNESAWKDAEILHNIPWEYIERHGKKIRTLWAAFAQSGSLDENLSVPEILYVKEM